MGARAEATGSCLGLYGMETGTHEPVVHLYGADELRPGHSVGERSMPSHQHLEAGVHENYCEHGTFDLVRVGDGVFHAAVSGQMLDADSVCHCAGVESGCQGTAA